MLFLKELKKIMRSVPYAVFVAAMTLGLASQGVFQFQEDLLQEPKPGGSYGFQYEEIPEIVMPAALEKLWGEFCANDYQTYPIGFIKHVKLGDGEQAEMAGILSEITGHSKEAILRESAGNAPGNSTYSNGDVSFQVNGGNLQQESDGSFAITPESNLEGSQEGAVQINVSPSISYPHFKELMGRADRILGGGSSYQADSMAGFGAIPLTYQEAKERYALALKSDRVTGGYARLFSDYAGVIALSLLPVFPAVILCMKDRRSKMDSLIYARQTSAARLIFSRYLALVAAAMLPAIILSYLSNMKVWGSYSGLQLDCLAPLKYSLGWMLPTVMASAAVGMLLTELTGTPIAIVLQGLWWLLDTNAGIRSLSAGYGLFRLTPRHNVGAKSWFQTQDYLDNWGNLAGNRLLLAAASLLLVLCAVFVYEAKRKGKFDGRVSFKGAFSHIGNRKSKPMA